MPSKKKKYNARFPAGRIKKIMQTDEEVGKVAQAVPIIISRTIELFVESLIKKSIEVTNTKKARTLSPQHMKECILNESRFDFLRDLVKGVPEVANSDDDFIPFPSSDLTSGKSQPRTSSNSGVEKAGSQSVSSKDDSGSGLNQASSERNDSVYLNGSGDEESEEEDDSDT